MTPDPDARRAYFIRQAMARPDKYLAVALAELTDEVLAAELGTDPRDIWPLRLATRPRAAHWDADVYALARSLGADPRALEALLLCMGVRK
jgi:hypothetical protein